jgi:hypothetical protein
VIVIALTRYSPKTLLVAKDLDVYLIIIRHIYQHFTSNALLLEEFENKERGGTPGWLPKKLVDGLD